MVKIDEKHKNNAEKHRILWRCKNVEAKLPSTYQTNKIESCKMIVIRRDSKTTTKKTSRKMRKKKETPYDLSWWMSYLEQKENLMFCISLLLNVTVMLYVAALILPIAICFHSRCIIYKVCSQFFLYVQRCWVFFFCIFISLLSSIHSICLHSLVLSLSLPLFLFSCSFYPLYFNASNDPLPSTMQKNVAISSARRC